MQLYFSMWAYRDPNRVGYDSFGASYYMKKPDLFREGWDGQTAYYVAEIPDTFTEKQAEEIAQKTLELLKTGYYSNAQWAVDRVLAEMA